MMKVRKLKNAVGTCSRCGSSAVLSVSGKYSDGKKHISVTCCHPDCGVHTQGYDSNEAAIRAWNSTWQAAKKEVV